MLLEGVVGTVPEGPAALAKKVFITGHVISLQLLTFVTPWTCVARQAPSVLGI